MLKADSITFMPDTLLYYSAWRNEHDATCCIFVLKVPSSCDAQTALQEPLLATTSGQHDGARLLGEGIRSDFPILHQKVHGDKQLIYFDNGATSQKPKEVLEALRAYNEEYNANVHRGVHYLAAKVGDAKQMSDQA